MKLSVIVPVYNSATTLAKCLEAIYASDHDDFEVIVVDDRSTDMSAETAQKFPCKVVETENRGGAGHARNTGCMHAAGEILVFIDADVIVQNDALLIIYETLSPGSDMAGVSGMLSRVHPNTNFFSQYKNLYMNFVFSQMPQNIDFLFGSVCAVKKDDFIRFREGSLQADDTDLGQKYKHVGKYIRFEKKLEVIHLKKYTFLTFIRNDFNVPYSWAFPFVKYKGLKDVFVKKRFAHAKWNQLLSVLISPLIIIIALGAIYKFAFVYAAAILIVLFLVLNSRFFMFLLREKGIFFAVRAAAVTYFDMFVMGAGISVGIIHAVFAKNKNCGS